MDKIISLGVKNFKSVGGREVWFNFEDFKGLSLIKGKNGKGKTLIISAITYAIYGKNSDLKGSGKTSLPVSELINDVSCKDLIVDIEVIKGKDTYRIVRGEKPKILEIYKNDEKLSEQSRVSYDQAFIEKEILDGMTYELFSKVVYLSNKATSIPFLYLTPLQRKEFIEEILEVRMLHLISERIKKKRNSTKMEIKRYEGLVEQKKASLINIGTLLKTQKLAREKLMEDKEHKLNGLKEEIHNHQYTLALLDDEITRLRSNVAPLDSMMTQFRDKLKGEIKLKREIQEAEDDLFSNTRAEDGLQRKLAEQTAILTEVKSTYEKYDVCGTCPTLPKLIDTSKVKRIEDTIAETQDTIETTSKATTRIKTLIEELKGKLPKYEQDKEKLTKLESGMKDLINKTTEKITEHKNIESHLSRIETQIKDIDKELPEVDITPLAKEKASYDALVTQHDDMISKNSSYNGLYDVVTSESVRKSLFDVYIPLLRKYIKEFIHTFTSFDQASFDVDIDDSFNITFYKNRKEYNMFSLSEGQKASINLSFTFAFQKLLELKGSVNFLMIDEILDIAFDEDRLEYIVEALQQLADNKDIFVISHNQGINLEMFDNIITVDMNNGFSEYKIKTGDRN